MCYTPCPDTVPEDTSDTMLMPMERLEARICELAGHLTAATCQFLLLVADFDARRGWADWEMPSCAAWLSWKCQIAPGTAREQVRVARALAGFPLFTAEFGAGRLSYAKVRALTRIATAETEKDLAEMAAPMTASQLERFAQAHRRVSAAEDGQVRANRKLSWGRVDEMAFAVRGYFPPQDWAVVLQALRAARDDLEHPHEKNHEDDSARTRADKLRDQDVRYGIDWGGDTPPGRRRETAQNLADALVQICAAYLNGKAARPTAPTPSRSSSTREPRPLPPARTRPRSPRAFPRKRASRPCRYGTPPIRRAVISRTAPPYARPRCD